MHCTCRWFIRKELYSRLRKYLHYWKSIASPKGQDTSFRIYTCYCISNGLGTTCIANGWYTIQIRWSRNQKYFESIERSRACAWDWSRSHEFLIWVTNWNTHQHLQCLQQEEIEEKHGVREDFGVLLLLLHMLLSPDRCQIVAERRKTLEK